MWLPRVMVADSHFELRGAKDDILLAASKTRVLVVDDNKDAAGMLSLFLETVGHDVSVSYNAQNALVVAARTSPAILFVDIGLPDMDGYELARRLRARPETARSLLIAVTGYGQPQDQEHAMQAGFDHHLFKPVKRGMYCACSRRASIEAEAFLWIITCCARSCIN